MPPASTAHAKHRAISVVLSGGESSGSTRREHILRLYEDEQSLYKTVADVVVEGFTREEPCLLIAASEHLLGIAGELSLRGQDCGALERDGRLSKVDAQEILSQFAPDADFDESLCRQGLADLISRISGPGARPVVVYGEVVNLLWKTGRPRAAIRLEQIWNDLQKEYAIRLLCGYAAEMFGSEDRELLEMVCHEHSLCLPPEKYLKLNERSRLQQVVLLEQRARDLEAEVQRRRAATEELARFNRAAVGREMRIIELKEEVNELRARLGEPARYSGTRDSQKPDAAWAPAAGPPGLVPLESILVAEELDRRPARPPQYAAEHSALMALMQALADTPRTIFQTLADKVLELTRADSAGLSLLTDDGERFYWAAIAGQWQPHAGGGTPRNFGPCGDVLDCEKPLLFTHWERRYPYLAAATPLAEEGLLVPFFVRGKAVGTIWAIAHDSGRKFDAEDLRLLESLGRFASAAHEAVQTLSVFEQRHAALSLLEDHVEQANRLRETNQHLARANDDLGHFAFAASHDLQETLRVITTYSELLVKNFKDAVDEQTCAWVRFITHATNQMQRLLNDLLAYTGLIGGTYQGESSLVDLNAAFRQACEDCQASIQACQAVVTSDPLPAVQGHQPHLVELFQNLVGNALKYRSERPPRVHVSATLQDGEWRLAVADNGIGIEPEFHQRVFDVFKRLHGREIPGTGMGLAICKRLVERYGGRIWVESKKNEGATFYFTLPAEGPPASQL